jgi:very-short-patch-repair endonuclease
MKTICCQCGDEFNARKGQKFCSRKCFSVRYSNEHRITNVCLCCGKEFSIMKCAGDTRKFCTQRCSNKYNFKGKHKSYEHSKKISASLSAIKPTQGEFICDRCGRYFKNNLSLRGHKAHCGHKKHMIKCGKCGKIIVGRSMTLHKAHCNGEAWAIDALKNAKIANSVRISVAAKTDIELILGDYFYINNIKYIRQHRILPKEHNDSHCYDFYIPAMKLLVEADGDYWHSSEEQKKKDVRHNKTAKDNGYKIIRYFGSDIHKNPCKIIQEIIEYGKTGKSKKSWIRRRIRFNNRSAP